MKLFKALTITALTLIAISGTAHASSDSQTLAININDEDVELSYYGESEYSEYSKVKSGYGGLKAVDEFGETNNYLHASFSNTGLTDMSGIVFGIGFDLSASYIAQPEKIYSAVGLMVKAGYIFPFNTLTTLIGSITYAPQTLCISQDLESHTAIRIQGEIEVIDGGSVFVGFRDISYNLTDATDYTFNRAPYAGFKLQFGGSRK